MFASRHRMSFHNSDRKLSTSDQNLLETILRACMARSCRRRARSWMFTSAGSVSRGLTNTLEGKGQSVTLARPLRAHIPRLTRRRTRPSNHPTAPSLDPIPQHDACPSMEYREFASATDMRPRFQLSASGTTPAQTRNRPITVRDRSGRINAQEIMGQIE